MLFGVVLGFMGFFQTRQEGKAIIDDFPFRLFYGFSCGILFLCTALVGLQDLVGKNIDCYTHGKESSSLVNQYCWVTGTHLLVKTDDQRGFGEGTYYGEEKCYKNDDGLWVTPDEGLECVKTHSYYQWVPYVLLLQGVLFYLPRQFWLKFEEGKMSSISDGIRVGTATASATASASEAKAGGDKISNVANNVANYINLKEAGHKSYGRAYFIAQLLNGLALFTVVRTTNTFLDGDFLHLGYRWLHSLRGNNTEEASVLLYRTFPRLTRCEFQTYATGGHVQTDNYLCLLAPNIISEKIFVFLWFWYAVLAVVVSVNIVLILLMVFHSQTIRSWFLMRAVYSKKLGRHLSSHDDMSRQLQQMDFGKFLFLYLLGRNVDFFVYRRILDTALSSEADDDEDSGRGRGQGDLNFSSETGRPGTRLTRELSRRDVQDAGEEEVTHGNELPMYSLGKVDEATMGEDEGGQRTSYDQATMAKDYPLKKGLD